MAIKVPYLLVADAIHEMPNGKIQVVGIFDRIFISGDPPKIHPELIVVALLAGQNEDDLGEKEVIVRLLRPDGRETVRLGGPLTFEITGGEEAWFSTRRIVIKMRNVPIYEFGKHRVVVEIDGTLVAEYPLLVRNAPTPAQQ